MSGNELFPQSGDLAFGAVGEGQLIRIRPAVRPDGHRFAAPNELGAALPEMSPAPPRQLARPLLDARNGRDQVVDGALGKCLAELRDEEARLRLLADQSE